jgi:hypothetical protein
MQIPLTRAFAMKPTNNDIDYMKTKTNMIMCKIVDSIVFAKRHNMPELVESNELNFAVTYGYQILNMTESEARNKNRTIKPKVYGIFISLLENFAFYIYQLTSIAIGKEYPFAFGGIHIFNKLCEEFKFEVAKGELEDAMLKREIDYDTFTKKIEELCNESVQKEKA